MCDRRARRRRARHDELRLDLLLHDAVEREGHGIRLCFDELEALWQDSLHLDGVLALLHLREVDVGLEVALARRDEERARAAHAELDIRSILRDLVAFRRIDDIELHRIGVLDRRILVVHDVAPEDDRDDKRQDLGRQVVLHDIAHS